MSTFLLLTTLAILTVLGVLYLGFSVVWFVIVALFKLLLFAVEVVVGLGWWVVCAVAGIAVALLLAPGILVLAAVGVLLWLAFRRRRPERGDWHGRESRRRMARYERVMASY